MTILSQENGILLAKQKAGPVAVKLSHTNCAVISNFNMTGSGKGKDNTWAPWNWYPDALKAFYDV